MRITDRRFAKAVKRLHHDNQKEAVDEAIRIIGDSPAIGKEKKAELAGLRVHKFHMVNQLVLLAYLYGKEAETVTLVDLGSQKISTAI